MSGPCGTIDPQAWVRGLIAATDCQAGLLGSGGWQGLSESMLFNVLLTGLLTIAIARLGYRLMAGQVMPQDIAMLLAHMGVVIALATSWQAYNQLIYRVATDGPAEIAGELFPAGAVEASNLSARLQNAYDTLAPQRARPTEPANAAADPSSTQSRAGVATSESASAPESLAMADRRAAADVMVIAGAGSWMAARLALGLLLALGPFAFAASLFPVSAGLFIGWLRAVLGFALALLAIPVAIAIELQLLQGPVRAALRAEDAEIAGLSAIVWSFALVILGLLFACHRLAGGINLAPQVIRMMQPFSPKDENPSAAVTVTVSNGRSNQPGHRVSVTEQAAQTRTMAMVKAVEARERTFALSDHGFSARPAPGVQSVPASGARLIRRGSQIVDGVRRTASDRGQRLSQRPEAQA